MAPEPHLRAAHREKAVAALCAPELAAIVDLVVWVEDGTALRRQPPRPGPLGRRRHPGCRDGTDPIGSEDPMAFLPYEREVADPLAGAVDRQLLPVRRARLLLVLRRRRAQPRPGDRAHPRHQFLDDGGHIGEHGSLDVIQSRAPLVLAGAGVARCGFVDDHAWLVDVGPTLRCCRGAGGLLTDADGAALDGASR